LIFLFSNSLSRWFILCTKGFKFPESPGGGCFADPATRCALGTDDPKFKDIPAQNRLFRKHYGTDEGALVSDPKRMCVNCNSPVRHWFESSIRVILSHLHRMLTKIANREGKAKAWR
jgi:hypothetical protein